MSKLKFPLAVAGKKVSVARRTGVIENGVVHDTPVVVTAGTYVRVNFGTKKEPQIISVRPSQLRRPI